MISHLRPGRISAAGKYLVENDSKFYIKGVSYGPFAPNSLGEPLPELAQLRRDFSHLNELGANSVRVYFPPPLRFLDEAAEAGLRVLVDVPWEKHRCFFEDWNAQEDARRRVIDTARRMGNHPAVLGISVVNEIPVDVVRFHGRQRVERFVDELMDSAKQIAPECLMTFVNFPTTEFLTPTLCDFWTFNVYVHDEQKLRAYLDRLQHIAANKPLVLGEYGIDTIREGEREQARLLQMHLQSGFRHGLAGSFIFAYTDDWYTGGHQIDDWAFGVTRRDRSEKPAAQMLRATWESVPHGTQQDWPKVSVVVCSYNGASTLRRCLDSLMEVDYPEYEIVLVDDGSTDNTPEIAAEFPQVIYRRQENRGLSVARNVGAELANGEIVAYTDSDCEVDPHWLRYLVQAMEDQQVEAIGGPNITPLGSSWTAYCVAASPGNPSHVMLDDHHAEHVPGCNMAFKRSTLRGIGGFDPQFRQAGDDVDICWRFLDAGLTIGYASGAMVWHHRRPSVKAYARQQKGYGRSEAMVHFKHPQRCGTFGRSSWRGIIYGDGAVGLPLMPQRIYHGQFGTGLFQTIYRHNDWGVWSVLMSLEWHLTALFLLALSSMAWPLAIISGGMWTGTLAMAIRSAHSAPLPRRHPRWCRPLVGYLYILQPILRGWHRLTYLLANKRVPDHPQSAADQRPQHKKIRWSCWDLYWDDANEKGREHLLPEIVSLARGNGWKGDFDNAWAAWDIKLVGTCWHDITIRTATEELGWPRRFTRARCVLELTRFARVALAATVIWLLVAALTLSWLGLALGMLAGGVAAAGIIRSHRRCLAAITGLVSCAASEIGLGQSHGAADSTAEPPPLAHRQHEAHTLKKVALKPSRNGKSLVTLAKRSALAEEPARDLKGERL